MTQTSPIQTQQIPPALRLSAAERLVASPGRPEAAKRLIASASTHGIDLALMWGVVGQSPDARDRKIGLCVRQVALAVLGPGRTAMIFLSNPDQSPRRAHLGPVEIQINEIGAAARAALTGLRADAPAKVTLAQTLIEPDQAWAKQACTQAGMICVGELDYMQRPITPAELTPAPPHHPHPDWPAGIQVRPVRSLDPNAPDSDRQALIEALEGSYQETLDCPELCGLRPIEDVIDSHLATGEFDPSRWHLIFKDDQPAGCCLLSHCPQSTSVELVYLGLAPIARGLGLGRSVLSYAIAQLGPIGITQITCAVDRRNAPAISIYESLGFMRFDARVGFVAPITPLPDAKA